MNGRADGSFRKDSLSSVHLFSIQIVIAIFAPVISGNVNMFEGYVGIRLWENQWVDDMISALLMCLLITFSFVFRFNYKLFFRMWQEAFSKKERLSLFDWGTDGKQETLFHTFMAFQFLFLSTIAITVIGRMYGFVHYTRWQSVLQTIFWTFGLLFIYYRFKQAFYRILGNVFVEPEKYRQWKISYNALMGIWGVSLYFPVLWMVFVGSYGLISLIMLIVFYVSCRFVIIFKTIRIFHRKNAGFLYISLYLCGQEIIPLVLLYESTVYLFNFIETSTLWR